MGLKNNNPSGELSGATDENKDSNGEGDVSSLAKNEDGLQVNAGESSTFVGNNSSENAEGRMVVSCSGDSKVDDSDQGVEVVESQSSSKNPGSHRGDVDRHLGYRKHGQLAEGSVYKLSSYSAKCHDHDEKLIRPNKSAGSDEIHEKYMQSSPDNDVDEYEIEEEDVKVCDICGDAGREDLLAVCSRCSDGAEHTYCMHEMLDKVPEGDWLCEECKYTELEERKQEPFKMLGMNERSRLLGRNSSVNNDLLVKLDGKDSLCERSKMKNAVRNKQIYHKRSGDSFEAGPTAKRQALDSSMGSPMSSTSNRLAVMLKDYKSLDKIKGKPSNKLSTATESTDDSSEIACSPTTNSHNAFKGNFMKSNSFSSGNSKLDVKVSDEALQKQKHGVDAKDWPGKLIAKSMSFKGLSRSSVSEPKVKMLSPQCTPVQEFKGQKQGRDRNSFERKNTIKLDHSVSGQMATGTSKRPSRGDNISSGTVPNNRDHKNCQSDVKPATFSKQYCQLPPKLSDCTASTEEAKRLSSTSISESVSVNGTSSYAEAKSSLVSLKEVSMLNLPQTADRSTVVDNGAKSDVLDYQNEKVIENSFGRYRQVVNDGGTGGNRREVSVDASASRPKEGMRKENNLKAAIEAAMQKKQDIFKKNKNLDKPNELSTLNSRGHHVDAVLNISRDALSEEGMLVGDAARRNHVLDSCKQASIGSMKQLKGYPADGSASIQESVLTVSAIPEQESIWQGGFEIRRSGRFSDMCGGFQAHLSSTASGKVLEAVKKFPQKIILDEVPRSCVWPMQFKETGAREENIALYFFAKDLESYIRNYKIVVDYLMKHDLALRGNVNEVELLVFPSNHLPDKFQCWNTLFFMWGVFRGRRPICADNRPNSPVTPEISKSQLNPLCKDDGLVARPDESCLHRPAMEDSFVSGSGHLAVSACDTSASVRSSLQNSTSLSNGDCYGWRCLVGQSCLSSRTSPENPSSGGEYNSSSSGAETWSKSESTALIEHCNQESVKVADQQHLAKEIGRSNRLLETPKSPSDHVQIKQDISSRSCEWPLISEEVGGSAVSSEQHAVDTTNKIDQVKSENKFKSELDCLYHIEKKRCEVKTENDVKREEDEVDFMRKDDKGKLKLEDGLKKEGYVDISADTNMEEFPFSEKQPCVNSTNSITQAASAMTSQKKSWMNGEDPLEGRAETCTNRTKGGDDSDGCNLYRFPSCVRYSGSGVSTSSQRDGTSNEPDDEKSTPADPGSLAERYLFLVDRHPTSSDPGTQLGDESVHWKVGLADNEDRLPDGSSPNLELALGVEKKQSRPGGVLPCFVGLVDKKDTDRPPNMTATSKEDGEGEEAAENKEDASAGLSLSLAFPFSDMERPPTSVEQTLAAGRHDLNTSLLLFRSSSHK